MLTAVTKVKRMIAQSYGYENGYTCVILTKYRPYSIYTFVIIIIIIIN